MSDDAEPLAAPFTVLIDSAEQHPFSFGGFKWDSHKKYRPMFIPTRRICLGRHPDSRGDYSIEGLLDWVGIERKSLDDIICTVLGWDSLYERKADLPGRRDRFKRELENLAKLPVAAVVIEAHKCDCLQSMPAHGKKTIQQNALNFNRSVLAFQQDYRIPWHWCHDRRDAEITTFRILERSYKKWTELNNGQGKIR